MQQAYSTLSVPHMYYALMYSYCIPYQYIISQMMSHYRKVLWSITFTTYNIHTCKNQHLQCCRFYPKAKDTLMGVQLTNDHSIILLKKDFLPNRSEKVLWVPKYFWYEILVHVSVVTQSPFFPDDRAVTLCASLLHSIQKICSQQTFTYALQASGVLLLQLAVVYQR